MKWTRWAAVAALLVTLAGCSATGTKPGALSITSTSRPARWVAPSCPSPQAPLPPGQAATSGGGIPADFHVVWVLRCESRTETLPGRGQWLVQYTERADTSATGLIAQLNRPSAPPATPPVPCALVAVSLDYFALVDAHGRALAPTVPTGPCGQPLPGVATALQALPFRTMSTTPIRLLLSQAALDTGCAQQWKDQLSISGMPIRAGQPELPWPTPPSTIRVCEYQRQGGTANFPVGEFQFGHVITGSAATELAQALAQTAPAVSCTAPNTHFAILFGQTSSTVFVELDGCLRMQGPSGTASQVPRSVVDKITAKG